MHQVVHSTRRALLAAFLLIPVTLAWAVEPISIAATRKTVDRYKGAEQDLARGKSRSTETRIMYRFDLQSRSPTVPPDVEIEWMVMVEGGGGNIFPGTMGRTNLDLAFGQPVAIESGEIVLAGREWRGGPRPGTIEDSVAGYGIRVRGPDGDILAEKYDPSSVESLVQWQKLDVPAAQGGSLLRKLLRPSTAPRNQPGAPSPPRRRP